MKGVECALLRIEGASINSIKPTKLLIGARQSTAKKRSMDGDVSILSRVLTQQARLQWIYRSALEHE